MAGRSSRERRRRRCAPFAGLLGWAAASLAPAAFGADDPIADAARAFGSMPAIWNVELSPSGQRLAYLRMHERDVPTAAVLDFEKKTLSPLIASEPGKVDLVGCGWATEERLICSFHGVDEQAWVRFGFMQLLAIDADGSDARDLGHQTNSQYERVVDWLVDDPKRVILPRSTRSGVALISMDIHTTRHDWVKQGRGRYSAWATDGRGNLRLRFRTEASSWIREVLPIGKAEWEELYTQPADEFRWHTYTVGFGADPNHLLMAKRRDGRYSISRVDLANGLAESLVWAHDEVDAGDVVKLGKYRRVVGVEYTTGRPQVDYFDDRVREVATRSAATFPGQIIEILAESWDQRYYVVRAYDDRHPGSIYRLDTQGERLIKVGDQYPLLAGRELAAMKGYRYPARDGVTVPAYLTLPPGAGKRSLPTIVLPHSGPEIRDEWGFDWLAQFLASRGYLVVQANYRGSGGYGLEWAGDGGYQAWRLAMSDIEDGIARLVDKGFTDPDRVCIVGWGYGGFAALVSSIEHPRRYRCAVSIAGATDLDELVDDARDFEHRRSRRTQVGGDAAERKAGSPLQRVDEIPVPVLLFHGENDVDVYVEHSQRLADAMKKAGKPVELVTYADTEHSLDRNAARIDMLTRIGRFLDEHLAKRPAAD